MKNRSPLHDRTDPQLVHRCIANMKQRHEGTLSAQTLDNDIVTLEEEIVFSEQRVRTLRERCEFATRASAGTTFGANGQVFGELLQETEQELYRLYNARQFLKAEQLTNEGMPKEQIAEVLAIGDAVLASRSR